MISAEVERLRAAERFNHVGNALCDFAIYQIMLCSVIANDDRARVIAQAVTKFGAELPRDTITGIVDAMIVKELRARERAAELRKMKLPKRARGGRLHGIRTGVAAARTG